MNKALVGFAWCFCKKKTSSIVIYNPFKSEFNSHKTVFIK